MKRLSTLVAAGVLAAMSTHAMARVHVVRAAQSFYFQNDDFSRWPRNVAIDGDSAIAILNRPGGRQAVAFQRNGAGQWTQGPVLLDVNTNSESNDDLAMGNGVAAIRIGTGVGTGDDVMHIFERSGSG